MTGINPITSAAALVVAAMSVLHNSAVQAADREPTEKEMRAAVQAKFDAVNANMRSTWEDCERREFRNDPLMAIQCLQIGGASGGRGDLAYNMTRFQKLGCAKGQGQAGYVCDFAVGFSSNSPYAQGSLNQITGGGNAGQGRFLPQQGGWLFLPIQQGGRY